MRMDDEVIPDIWDRFTEHSTYYSGLPVGRQGQG